MSHDYYCMSDILQLQIRKLRRLYGPPLQTFELCAYQQQRARRDGNRMDNQTASKRRTQLKILRVHTRSEKYIRL